MRSGAKPWFTVERELRRQSVSVRLRIDSLLFSPQTGRPQNSRKDPRLKGLEQEFCPLGQLVLQPYRLIRFGSYKDSVDLVTEHPPHLRDDPVTSFLARQPIVDN